MLRSYIVIALRNIKRHNGYSFINIAGLAIGMTCCILILLWVMDELSYDRYHENADRIYRLCVRANMGSSIEAPVSNGPAAPAMVEKYPEVESAARMTDPEKASVKYGDVILQEENVAYADNSIFDVFSFPFTSGDPKTALATAYSIVITEDMAEKYFGDEDPIGKILTLDGESDYTVTGVVRNVPSNSHFTFNMLRSFETLVEEDRERVEHWLGFSYQAYLRLAENTDYHELEKKFPDLVNERLGPVIEALGGSIEFFLQPLTRIHLYSTFELDSSTNGDITYVYLFTAIALFILLIACFNFINLATARSATRAKEVGMRKTVGAFRGKLIRQFLGESIIYCLFAIVLALILIELFLPVFNDVAGRELSLDYGRTWWFIPALLGFAVLVGLLAGMYPAFFLSSYQPASVLKGSLRTGPSNPRFRSTLVVIQFVISITLITGTLIIKRQLSFMKNNDLGFDKEHVVVIPRMGDFSQESMRTIKSELSSVPGVTHATISSNVPSFGIHKSFVRPEGFSKDQNLTMDVMSIDPGFFETLDMELVAGRNFSAELATDTSSSAIINETAARQIGWDNPVGKTFIFDPTPGDEGETQVVTVVGVVKDFHLYSLHQKIEPLYIDNDMSDHRYLSLRIAADNIPRTIDRLKEKWEELVPNRTFEYRFLDESFNEQYESDERLGKITLYFSLLAVFIGCLGLFGISAYAAERRTKEIGIRKVLGATIPGIVNLLSRDFLTLVLIANVIAWPITYFAMSRWLEEFAYRIDVGWGNFILTGLISLVIALVTVSYQAIRAAIANPVRSLRYE